MIAGWQNGSPSRPHRNPVMCNPGNNPPALIDTEIRACAAAEFAISHASEWPKANSFDGQVSSCLKGPTLERAGYFYITEIPSGRLFRIWPAGDWQAGSHVAGWRPVVTACQT